MKKPPLLKIVLWHCQTSEQTWLIGQKQNIKPPHGTLGTNQNLIHLRLVLNTEKTQVDVFLFHYHPGMLQDKNLSQSIGRILITRKPHGCCRYYPREEELWPSTQSFMWFTFWQFQFVGKKKIYKKYKSITKMVGGVGEQILASLKRFVA